MALEVDLALFFFGSSAAGSGALVQFVVVVDNHAVVPGGYACVLDFFTVFEARGGEFDVMGLPSEGMVVNRSRSGFFVDDYQACLIP